MRVTNEERRRIANNLFEMYEDSLAARRKFRAYGVAEKMGIELIDSAGYVPDWSIKRLADLIDRPMCHLVFCDLHGRLAQCTNCGCEFELLHVFSTDGGWDYCPKCGREISIDD